MVDYYLGKKSGFAYAKESTYGTVNSASTWSWAGKVERFSDSDEQDMQPLIGLDDTNIRTIDEYYPMCPKFGATIEGKLVHMRFPAMGIGADTHSSGEHTIAIGALLPSFSMQAVLRQVADTPFVRQYTGCKIGKIEFGCSKGDWLKFACEVVAQKMTKVAAFKGYQTSALAFKKYTSAQMRPFRGSDMKVTINNVDVSPYVTQARLTLDNDLLVDASMDSDTGCFIAEPAEQICKIDAGITVRMKDTAIEDLFLAGADVTNCKFKWSRSATDYLEITFSGTKFAKAGAPIEIGSGVVIQELSMAIPTISIFEKNSITEDYDTAET